LSSKTSISVEHCATPFLRSIRQIETTAPPLLFWRGKELH
jgi:hypothetical protein